jgi:hypothetical protein
MNCQHTGCRCQVGTGESFCGDYCRDHAQHAHTEEHACECGHPGCQDAAAV